MSELGLTVFSAIPEEIMEKTTSSVIWSSKSFRWSIRNFSDICGLRTGSTSEDENGDNDVIDVSQNFQEYNCLLDIDFLQSPVIEVGRMEDGNQSKWLVKLMKSTEDVNAIDMHMEFVQIGSAEFENDDAQEDSECFFKYKIVIFGSNGQSIINRDTNKIIFLKSGRSWCEPAIIEINKLKDHFTEMLKDDTLSLQIDIFVLNDLHHSRIDGLATQSVESNTNSKLPIKKRKYNSYRDWREVLDSCQLQLSRQILNNLWKTRLNCDTTIECADVKFTVHESVLSSASSVFSAAFEHDMSEKSEKRIVITDMNPNTVETLLRFIYCDTNLDEPQWRNVDDLTDLLNAAEKYQIITLKSLVFSKLCEELTLNNAAHITSLVHLFQPEEKVRQFIHQYVLSNINVLKDMESFKNKLMEIPGAFTPLLLLIGK